MSAVSAFPTEDVDPRKRRTIDALLHAAEEIFGERPAEEVTVEEIAARAGVAVGSIYNHFGSKAGLQTAVVDRALALDRSYMDRAYTDGRSPAEQIAAAASEYLRFYLEHPDYFRMLAFPPEPGHYAAAHNLADRLAERVDEQNARLVTALQMAIDAGEARDVDARRVATFLWASWNGVISLAWRPDALRHDERMLRDLLEAATDVIVLGLQPRRAR